MTLYRVELREAAATALVAANTIAGANVFTARSLPIAPAGLPSIYLQVPTDRAESAGRSAPGFTRVAYLVVRGRVAQGGPGQVETALDTLAEQIELALMCDAGLQAMIQQVTEIQTEVKVSSETGDHLGEVRMLFGLEFTEYFPVVGTPLTQITGEIETFDNLPS